ncbi:3'-5' exonuclease [Conyzicola nivalis]|uniref:DNA 3'-5' helicase n=1 Tax=Conyzicola nivalis TaxID=1477021 RepID=A0A916SBX6_9MICO|nr:UvrD-helicase domain-containing protein [Conyzicola nivalis]GGA93480.1 DNA helicase [Conyzicola nivalis]
MTTIVMTSSVNKTDGAIKKKLWAFIEKLSQNDEMLGLHIEPMKNPRDSRVRTGRVDDNFRAVLFRLEGGGAERTYVYMGTWPHDEAIEIACSTVLRINPINGVAELIAEGAPETLTPVDVPASPSVEKPALVSTATPLLESAGITLLDLTDVLGMDPALASRAMAAADENELFGVAEIAPTWQGIALIDLAAGTSVNGVLAALDAEPVVAPERHDDAALIEAMKHPAAQMTFSFVHDNEELRRAIEDDNFAAWKVFLHPEQRRYVDRNYNGPFRLSGGAGTGKTVVLLHRARRLWLENPDARIVLTTFTVNLADNLRRDLRQLDPGVKIAAALGEPGVYVSGVDSLSFGALRENPTEVPAATQAVLGESRTIRGPATSSDRWSSARAASGVADSPNGYLSPTFLEAEYEAIIVPNTITTREEYFTVRRPGRGVALDRAKRDQVWKIVAAYRTLLKMQQSADFSEVAAVAAQLYDGGTVARPADHVLVDEGQDLVPAKWRLIRALTEPSPNDLFIAEDSHQRIYGQPTILSRWAIKIVGRSQRLTLNYRTTAQNLGYAVAVLEAGHYEDLESEDESTAGYRSSRRGPVPLRLGFATLSEELDAVASTLQRWSADDPGGSIAVLVRTNGFADTVTRGLAERDVKAMRVDKGEPPVGAVAVMNMYRAKGTEFSRVCIVGASAESIPNPTTMKSAAAHGDEADALLRERSLLYVAATRARDALMITWTGNPSTLLSE